MKFSMRKSVQIYSIAFILVLLLISGCSGSGGASAGAGGSGTYQVSVNWPDSPGGDCLKYIPPGSQLIEVSIAGDGLDSPEIFAITFPDTTITAENIPIGNKVATIRAFNASSELMAQRKEAFCIIEADTVHSDNIPLGIAVIGTTDDPAFEPTILRGAQGSEIYFQNWLAREITVQGFNDDMVLPAAATDLSGLWIFQDDSKIFPMGSKLSIEGDGSETIVSAGGSMAHVKTWLIPDFQCIFGIGTDGLGNVAVCDWGRGETGSGDLIKYDSNGNFLFRKDYDAAPQAGYFCSDVCGDEDGNIYVEIYQYSTSGYVTSYIDKYDSAGNFSARWGGGSGDYNFQIPKNTNYHYGLGYIYFIERGTHNIKMYNKSGVFQKVISADAGGTCIEPCEAIMDDAGDYIYVGDKDNHRIKKLDSNGGFIKSWGSYGTGNSQFHNWVRGIAFNDDKLYVADRSEQLNPPDVSCIKIFDTDGNFLEKFGGYSSDDSGTPYPYDIEFDQFGNMYSSEYHPGIGRRVHKFTLVP